MMEHLAIIYVIIGTLLAIRSLFLDEARNIQWIVLVVMVAGIISLWPLIIFAAIQSMGRVRR